MNWIDLFESGTSGAKYVQWKENNKSDIIDYPNNYYSKTIVIKVCYIFSLAFSWKSLITFELFCVLVRVCVCMCVLIWTQKKQQVCDLAATTRRPHFPQETKWSDGFSFTTSAPLLTGSGTAITLTRSPAQGAEGPDQNHCTDGTPLWNCLHCCHGHKGLLLDSVVVAKP